MPSCRKNSKRPKNSAKPSSANSTPRSSRRSSGTISTSKFRDASKAFTRSGARCAQTDPLRGGLRPVCHPDRLPAAAVPLGKDTVLADILDYHRHLHAETGSPARLDFDAQGQRLRSVALDSYGSRRSMGRGADPYATHGGDRRKGIRRSLKYKKRLAVEQRGRTRPLAQKDTRCTEWSDGKRRRFPG